MANSTGAEDPILPLYRKWLAARAEWNRLAEFERDETPEGEAHWNATFEASDQMQELTPVSPQGIAAIVHVYWYLEGPQCARWSESYKEQCEYDGNQLLLRVFSAVTGGGDLIEAESEIAKL